MITTAAVAPARIAALQQMPGLDVRWSRSVQVVDHEQRVRTWHVLDNGVDPVRGTLLCVHGNPTWSYLWRRFLTEAPEGWRVVAVDQLGMGFSDRTEQPRTYAQRVDDLGRLTEALQISGPTVVAAHDWGGPISLGWALEHRAQVRGLILTNTGVAAAPEDLRLIRLAQTPTLRYTLCARTPAFLRATLALSRPSLPAAVQRAFRAPYATAERRRAIADFVADVPLRADHPSQAPVAATVRRLPELREVPTLLLWGPRDPIFGDTFLDDLTGRFPQAAVHRYAGASHLVTEDAPQSARDAWRWVGDLQDPAAARESSEPGRPAADTRGIGDALLEQAGSDRPAVVELSTGTRISWRQLADRVDRLAGGMARIGVQRGDRVVVLVRPGAELTAAVYACWRLGAVIVVADAGLGLPALRNALRSAAPDHVIAIPVALAAVAALKVPGQRILAGSMPTPARRALAVVASLDELAASPGPYAAAGPGAGEAAVLFTSGATGPPKGVVYRHPQLLAQVEGVRKVMGIGPTDRLVAAFAPFALYGPAMGVPAAVPDMDVTKPGTLTATALAEAVAAVDGTVVFASPAALRNVAATADELPSRLQPALLGVRRVLSAGAPVPVDLLRDIQRLMPEAELHTPYGMTEALPVTDIDLAGIEAAGQGPGVCVGQPLAGVRVAVSPLGADGSADGELTGQAGVTGELLVAGAHVKDRYDRLWATERASSRNPGWHRTGDVGQLDDQGRVWVEGRLVHVVITADGPVTPVATEQRIGSLPEVSIAAVVGVGPRGTQQAVAVVVPVQPTSQVLAAPELAAAVRAVSPVPLAAVLTAPSVPTDIRHNSKIDRTRLGRWAERALTGRHPGKP